MKTDHVTYISKKHTLLKITFQKDATIKVQYDKAFLHMADYTLLEQCGEAFRLGCHVLPR